MSADYPRFLADKRRLAQSIGPAVKDAHISEVLFPFQRALVKWAVRKGRAALFADTGLGKTLMQLEWARLIGGRVLVVAPLSVGQQTVQEAPKLGITARYLRADDGLPGIVVTNYEMVTHFDPAAFGAVVLDESSILKSFDGKMRTRLIETFAAVPYRLCCTATPAPNDIQELANHAEFLGVMSRVEMLSEFFVHDDAGWRLKRHASLPFYRWLASWAMTLKRPSDLGFDDTGFDLPPLDVATVIVQSDYVPEGQLFHAGLSGIGDRAKVRRATASARVQAAADMMGSDQWIAWVGLNDEGRALAAALGDDAVLVEGQDSPESKHEAIERFRSGAVRVLITKPRIAGFGLNLQNCAHMAFVGINDSFEQFYQCVRRCWRFGQASPVSVRVIVSTPETAIFQNVMRKHDQAIQSSRELVKHVADFERQALGEQMDRFGYETKDAEGGAWRLLLGDSCERLAEVPDQSIGLSVFSPPFQSLYTYSPTERDLGNSGSPEVFWQHFGYIGQHLLRVLKPGRNVCIHVANLTTTKATDGIIGIKDFRGDMIRACQSMGFVFHGEVCIDKNPQAQAIRTHAKGLLFVQKNKDSTWSRPGLADYVLIFKVPGENQVPVVPDVSNEEWITWAHPIWYDIRETDTLNAAEGRGSEDERHICPLQLGLIERCIRLWSNPGETVLSPFAGIGSEGHEAVRLGRKFVGVELKPEYFAAAVKNLARADVQQGLFA